MQTAIRSARAPLRASDVTPIRAASASERLVSFFERRHAVVLALLVVALSTVAWYARFVLDDAFISFRYAANLVRGDGLVFNLGERVEGYSNFLWTLILGVPIALGIDPVAACYAIGPLLAALALWLIADSAFLLTGSRALGLLAVILTGTSPSFAHFATGGLETMLGVALQMGLVRLAVGAHHHRSAGAGSAAAASLLAALSLMTRIDSALLVTACLGVIAYVALGNGEGARRKWLALGLLLGPAALLVGVWLAWKYAYYGALLPNTYRAKLGAGSAWAAGFVYLDAFFTSTFLLPFLFLVAASLRRTTLPVAALSAAVAIYLISVAGAGGDFMEFRLLVPILPILMLLIVWAIFRRGIPAEIQVALLALLLAGSLHHALTFRYAKGTESVPSLRRLETDPAWDWVGIGKELGRLFGSASDLSIATSACGAIPYYSGLRTVDMLGLTDAWVAANGIPMDFPPGHRRAAPFEYLLRRRVNLVLGHPWVIGPGTPPEELPEQAGLRGFAYVLEVRPGEIPPAASLLFIPLGEGRSLVTLYLTPHPAIDAAIAANGWRRAPVPLF
jgi:hypothetical protein